MDKLPSSPSQSSCNQVTTEPESSLRDQQQPVSSRLELRGLRRTVQNYNVVLPLSRDSPLQVSVVDPSEICALVHAVSGVPSKRVFNSEIKVNLSQEEWVFKNEGETETRQVLLCGSPIKEYRGTHYERDKNKYESPPREPHRNYPRKKYCSYCGNRRSRSPSPHHKNCPDEMHHHRNK